MEMIKSPIINLGEYMGNHLWMKREDYLPFSFGGNKARKAQLFFKEIDENNYDCVVTYGSSSSNHCRIIANGCCKRGLECHVISPEEASKTTFNSKMIELFGAEVITVPTCDVHDAIESLLSKLKTEGKKPYFIQGGGHGLIGTEAYVQCYQEIKDQELELGTLFDYIFFASGTGTTHAGLVCGKLMHSDDKKIVGISIARKNPYGRDVVLDSIRSYMGTKSDEESIQDSTLFIDDYTDGYGKCDKKVIDTIKTILKAYGIPLDATYTGKAFMGMTDYLLHNKISGMNVLFIHTGGTPLFFDTLIGIES